MFSSLDDQIQETNGEPISRTRQLLRVLSVLGVTSIVFGTLYLGVLLLE